MTLQLMRTYSMSSEKNERAQIMESLGNDFKLKSKNTSDTIFKFTIISRGLY